MGKWKFYANCTYRLIINWPKIDIYREHHTSENVGEMYARMENRTKAKQSEEKERKIVEQKQIAHDVAAAEAAAHPDEEEKISLARVSMSSNRLPINKISHDFPPSSWNVCDSYRIEINLCICIILCSINERGRK